MIIDKYNIRAEKINSLLCVGLDPDLEKLPEKFKALKHPQFEFNKYIIEETHEYVSAYKPNMGSYEVRGKDGWEDLAMTMEYLREKHPDIFTICDAKRGDIGYTNELYAKAIFDILGFDAVTLHPYLGKEALKPFLDRKDKVSIILCRTSNLGAGELQDLKIVGELTLLVPGIGTQGGSVKEVMNKGMNVNKMGLIMSSSKAIIFSPNPKEEARKLRDEIRQHSLV